MGLPPDILLSHAYALFVVWSLALVPGLALFRFLPSGLQAWDRFLLFPLLGAAYWPTALYLLPFDGGLFLAIGLATVLASPAVIPPYGLPYYRNSEWCAFGMLAIAALAYASPLFVQYVPLGMDASMYAYNARVIGAHVGLS